jgi:hypothetical protein
LVELASPNRSNRTCPAEVKDPKQWGAAIWGDTRAANGLSIPSGLTSDTLHNTEMVKMKLRSTTTCCNLGGKAKWHARSAQSGAGHSTGRF